MQYDLEEVTGLRDLLIEIFDPTVKSPEGGADGFHLLPPVARKRLLTHIIHQISDAQNYKQDLVEELVQISRKALEEAELIIWDGKLYTQAIENAGENIGQAVSEFLPNMQLWLYAPQPVVPDGIPTLNIPPDSILMGTLLIPTRFGQMQDKEGVISLEIYSSTEQSRMGQLILRFWWQLYDAPMGQLYVEIAMAQEFLQSEADWQPQIIPQSNNSRIGATRQSHESRYCIEIMRRLPDVAKTSRSSQHTQGREYQCQFQVREHLRHLPQPRKSDGAVVTTVRSHIRGPEGKPLKESREKIIKVIR